MKFLDRESDKLDEYAGIEVYIKGEINTFEQSLQELIRSKKISDNELILLLHYYSKDDYIYGKISENTRKREGFDAKAAAFEKQLEPSKVSD